MSQNSVAGASRTQRLAVMAHVGIIAGVWLSAPFLVMTALQPWRVSPLEAGVAVAPADDVIRNGLQIQEPVAPAGVHPMGPITEGDQRAAAVLRTWRYTGSSGGATGAHGGGGNHGSPGH
jgi:hypothetical protein